MNNKYTKEPERYAGFFFAENKITHPDYQYIIHLGFPRFMVKWHMQHDMDDFDSFFANADIQWLDADKPTDNDRKYWLTEAWNYLAIEDRILEDDIDSIDDDDDNY